MSLRRTDLRIVSLIHCKNAADTMEIVLQTEATPRAWRVLLNKHRQDPTKI